MNRRLAFALGVVALIVSPPAAGQTPPAPTNDDCLACHGDASAARANGKPVSVRADTLAASVHAPLACVDCHQDLATQTEWPHPERLAQVSCAACHEEPVARYQDSIHWRAIAKSGLTVAPNCRDCHGSHDIQKRDVPGSRVHRANIPATCGSCHEGIHRQYRAGVHGSRLQDGVSAAPVCADCHSAHAITRADVPAFQLGVIQECGTCHASKAETFGDTFHGQVTALGFERVAKCADCHGAHDVRPARDPASSVAPANLVRTCSPCHPGANANFVQYDPHADKNDRARNPSLYFASRFMSGLLIAVFTFFGLHTSLWGLRSLRDRRKGSS